MAPSRSTTVGQTPIRRSCDRCHRQKLRCTRTAGNDTGACSRCLRRRASCVYSFALPSGRPSVHHQATNSEDREEAPSPAPTPRMRSLTPSSEAQDETNENPNTNTYPSAKNGPESDRTTPQQLESPDPADGLPRLLKSGYDLQGSQPGGDKNDPGNITLLLSHLSIRLSYLRRAAYDLAKSSQHLNNDHQDQQKSPGSDTSFDSVAAWVAHGPANMALSLLSFNQDAPPPLTSAPTTMGSLLRHTFLSSNQMLAILRRLSPVDSVEKPSLSPNTRLASYSSDNAMHHLLIACHTLLMDIYITVLKVLEQDTSLNKGEGTATIGEVRLSSIVQLCSYLTERQHLAMCVYLSHQSSSLSVPRWPGRGTGSSQGALQPFPDNTIRDEMRDLKMEVQEQLSRLQQTLDN